MCAVCCVLGTRANGMLIGVSSAMVMANFGLRPYMLLSYSRTHGHTGLNHLKVFGMMNGTCVVWTVGLFFTMWFCWDLKKASRRALPTRIKAISQKLKKMRYIEEHQRHLISDDIDTIIAGTQKKRNPTPEPAPAADGRVPVRRRDPRKPTGAQGPARGVTTLSKKARKEKAKAEKEQRRDNQLAAIRKIDPLHGLPELY